jgi:hypothetical protein
MKALLHKTLCVSLFFLCLCFGQGVFAQASGDFRSATSGNWGAATTWERFNGTIWEASGVGANTGLSPTSATSVYIQTTHLVTMVANADCKDLHIATGQTGPSASLLGRIDLGTFSLNVNGKMRTYFATLNTVPGTSYASGFAIYPFLGTGTAKVNIVGTSRTLFTSGEWSGVITTNTTGIFPLEFNMTPGNTATCTSNFRASTLNLVSGNVAALSGNIGGAATVGIGCTYASAGTFTGNGATQINGTFQISQGGYATVGTTGTWAYGPAATLIYNVTSGPYGINSGHAYWPDGANGPSNVTFSGGGGATVDMARTVSGTLTINSGPVGGTAPLTINGTCRINGGNFNTTPIYGPASTLVYNSNYGTYLEWTGGGSTSVAAGSGVPANLQILTGNVTLAGARGVPGSVTVNSGATLTLNSTSGNDIYIGGNLTMNGTLTHNTRTVLFVLGNAQTLSSTLSNVTFQGITLSKTAGTLTLAKPIIALGNVVMTSGMLDLGAYDMTVTGTMSGSATSYIKTSGIGQVKKVVAGTQVAFPVGNSSYNPLLLTNSGTSDTYGVNVLDDAVTAALAPAYAVNRRWQISELVAGGGNLAVIPQYNTADGQGASYNAASPVYVGLYVPTSWSKNLASIAGGDPFTATASNFTNTLSAGSYFAVGNNDAFAPPVVGPPTIASTSDAFSITADSAISGGNTIIGNSLTAKGLVWNTTGGATIASNAGITNAGTSTANFTSTMTGLSPQTRYYVTAYVSNGSGDAYANEKQFFTLSSPPTATAAGFAAVANGSTQVDLSWAAAGYPVGPNTGYLLLKRADGTNPTTSGIINGTAPGSLTIPPGTSLLANMSGASVSYNDSGLGSGIYNYMLIPYTWDGINVGTYNYLTASAPTATATLATFAPTTQPTALVFSGVTYNGMTASWTAASPSVAGYLVLRSTGVTSPDTDPSTGTVYTAGNTLGNATVAYAGAGLTTTLALIADNTQNNFEIYSYSGNGALITYLAASPLAGSQSTPNIVAPTATAATVATSSFTANWSAVTGAASYKLDVATDNGFTSMLGSYNNLTVGGTSQAVTGLTAGTSYYYRVRAVGVNSTSVNSNTITAFINYPSIAIVGSATAQGWPSDPQVDPNVLSTTDGVHYFLNNITLTNGTVKFRQNNSWTVSWGADGGFPVGTVSQAGEDLNVGEGTYSITLNKTTGAFTFVQSGTSTVNAKHVLFIGNSYTYYNSMPSMVEKMAASLGDNLITQRQTVGGTSLEAHFANTQTTGTIQQGGWDYVVLQDNSTRPSSDDAYVQEHVFPFAAQLSDMARQYSSCADVVFYQTWGRKNGDAASCPTLPAVCTYEGMDDLLQLRYGQMATDNDALLSPVAAVRRQIRLQYPALELYISDESHPTLLGSYVSALTFNTVLYRKDPTLITYNSTLSATEANQVKAIVKSVVFDHLATWSVGTYDPSAAFTYSTTGSTVNFVNNSVNAQSYVWNFGDSTTSTDQNPQHAFAGAGPYTVTLTATKCGRQSITTQTFTIGAPTGAAAQNFCLSATVANLTATGSNIQWYTASTGGTALLPGTSLANGHYYASQTENGVEGSSRLDVTVTISPATVAGNISGATTVCSGTNSTLLTLNGSTGSIQWQSSNNNATFNNIIGATGATYTASNLTATTYYKAVVTSGACGSIATSSVTVAVSNSAEYVNLQWPPSGGICLGGNYTTYGQVYKSGVTEPAGSGAGITAEFGYSTSNTDPSTWTNWTAATYLGDVGNNDEYTFNFVPVTSGTFYYAYRYRSGACNYQYGGFQGFWNGANNVNGVLTVNPNVNYYADADGDSFGNPLVTTNSCNGTTPAGYVTDNSDCNDNQIQYQDADGDGFGSGSPAACGVANNTDCDDTDVAMHATFSFYADEDGDTFGTGQLLNNVCAVDANTAPSGYSTNNTDCDDGNAEFYQTLAFYVDADNDGYGSGSATPVCSGNATVPSGYSVNSLDCDDTKSTVHPNAAEIGYNLIDDDCDGSVDEGFPPKVTVIQSAQCNNTLTSIDSYVYANLVAGAQGYRWRITTMSGPNAGQVQFINTALRSLKLTQLGTYAFNTTYKIEVAVYYSGYLQPFTASACTVGTPAAATTLTNCGQTLNTTADIIYANAVTFAAGYRFKISDPVNPLVFQELDRPLREFRMNLVTAFQVLYGKSYHVQVAVKNTDGSYLPYGAVCSVTTPVFPTTSLQDSQCDDFAPASASTQIFATSYPGVLSYVFNLTGNGLPTAGIEVVRSLRAFRLADFTGLIPGATYNVRVRLVFNASDVPGPYGKTCTVVVPALSRQVEQVTPAFAAIAYPNPFADSFNIDITSAASEKISLKIYDMTGRLLESQSVTVSGMQTLQAGSNFPSGVYNVIISHGDAVQSLRVVKR